MVQRGVVARGEDDQIHVEFFRDLCDFVECDAVANQCIAPAFRIELPPCGGVEARLAPLQEEWIRFRANNRAVSKVRGVRDRLDNVQQHEPGAESPGERLRVAQCLLRGRGKISWQKDLVDL